MLFHVMQGLNTMAVGKVEVGHMHGGSLAGGQLPWSSKFSSQQVRCTSLSM